MARICVFGERLAPPPDEGIKKLTLSLAAAYRRLGHEVLTLTTGAPDWPEGRVLSVEADRLLRSPGLAAHLAAFRPTAIVYVPTASLTLAAGLRCRTLKRYGGGAPVALFATQGRRHGRAVRLAGRLAACAMLGPDLCAAQSAATVEQARRLGWRSLRLPPGVDLTLFRPARAEEKAAARRDFGLPEPDFIVLHAGHLNRSRGVADLAEIADLVLPVLASSTSTRQDRALGEALQARGVCVLPEFIPNIARLYHAADAYLFPTPPDPLAASSIDAPLSVLEAAACDLPIITRPFGALPELWASAAGVHFYNDRTELREMVRQLSAEGPGGGTRGLAEPFSWEGVAAQLLDGLLGRPLTGRALIRRSRPA